MLAAFVWILNPFPSGNVKRAINLKPFFQNANFYAWLDIKFNSCHFYLIRYFVYGKCIFDIN